jgi:hypothetical protein
MEAKIKFLYLWTLITFLLLDLKNNQPKLCQLIFYTCGCSMLPLLKYEYFLNDATLIILKNSPTAPNTVIMKTEPWKFRSNIQLDIAWNEEKLSKLPSYYPPNIIPNFH